MALSDIEMKPFHYSHHRHARVSGMNVLITVVVVLAIFAAIWHWKNRSDERKHLKEMMTETSHLIP